MMRAFLAALVLLALTSVGARAQYVAIISDNFDSYANNVCPTAGHWSCSGSGVRTSNLTSHSSPNSVKVGNSNAATFASTTSLSGLATAEGALDFWIYDPGNAGSGVFNRALYFAGQFVSPAFGFCEACSGGAGPGWVGVYCGGSIPANWFIGTTTWTELRVEYKFGTGGYCRAYSNGVLQYSETKNYGDPGPPTGVLTSLTSSPTNATAINLDNIVMYNYTAPVPTLSQQMLMGVGP